MTCLITPPRRFIPRILTASWQPRPPPLPQQNSAPRSINVRAHLGNGRPIGRDANRSRQRIQAVMDLCRHSEETGGAIAMPSTQLKRGPLKQGGGLFRPGPTVFVGPAAALWGGVASSSSASSNSSTSTVEDPIIKYEYIVVCCVTK